MANKCECNNYELVREQEFEFNDRTFNLEVMRCTDCGRYWYGYDCNTKEEWESLNDVKSYIRRTFAD